MKTARPIATTALLLAALACGEATGPSFPGSSLLSVKGQLTLAGAPAPVSPIRLAIVWFPPAETNLLSSPAAIVTSDVAYQGTFPLDYSFDLFSVPPPSALSPIAIDGQTFHYAEGVLVAYEDLDGNGQLDSIPSGGAPIDHVLGTSIGDVYNGLPAQMPVYIQYVQGTPPASAPDFPAGYSLIDYDLPQGSQVLAASTPVALDLVGTNELDYLLCEADCAIAPTGGVRISGAVTRTDGSNQASVCLTTDGTTPLANSASASVQVNGQAIQFSAADNCFESFDGSLALHAPGANTVLVQLDGHAPWNFQVSLPGDFSLQSPAEGERVLTGSALPASWTQAPGAAWYELLSRSMEEPYTFSSELLIYGTSGTTTMPSTPGDEWVAALALTGADYQAEGLGGSSIAAYVQAVTEVQVVAPGAVSAAGTAGAYRANGGALSGFADVQVFSGATPAAGATVLLDGNALVYTPAYRDYEIDGAGAFVVEGAANSLSVQLGAQAQWNTQIFVPGDFSLTDAPSGPVPAGSQLDLAWTASAGATYYAVSIYGAGGQAFASAFPTGLSASLQVPAQAGSYQLYVVAIADGGGSDLYGQLQQEVDLTVE